MLGLAILIVAILTYFSRRTRTVSYFLYISLMLGYYGGFGLWNDVLLGTKTIDLALVYTGVISIWLVLKRQWWHLPRHWVTWFFWLFLAAFAVCAWFSYSHYHFSPFQILQGGRSFLLVLSLPILIRMQPDEWQRVFTWIKWMVVLTACLYLLQMVYGEPVMPYAGEFKTDPSTGLPRLYNFPALLTFFLCTAFYYPKALGRSAVFIQVLLSITLIFTLGRTMIAATAVAVALTFVLSGSAKTLIRLDVILFIAILPFSDTITARFDKGGVTEEDMEELMKFEYDERMGIQTKGATMTYRFAWIMERSTYLESQPRGEKLWGLGLISDSQYEVAKRYGFKLGLWSDELNDVAQLSTPDIAYGNMLTHLGYLGGSIYLLFILAMLAFFISKRKTHPMFLVYAATIIGAIINSFSGSELSETRNLCIYFIGMAFYFNSKRLPTK